MGFASSSSDPSIYTTSEGDSFIIGVYVDDLVLAGKNDKKMAEVKATLSTKFEMKDLGELHYFLGVKVVQNPEKNTIWIGQQTYTNSILQIFGMENAKHVSTPVSFNEKLTSNSGDQEMFNKET
jgi:hypothetical protein